MTGNGKNWIIKAEKFEKTYDIKSGFASKKPIPVLAKKMTKKFFVKVKWHVDPQFGEADDWLVQNGPGDLWPVDKKAFGSTYQPLEEHALENGTIVLMGVDGTHYDRPKWQVKGNKK